MPNRFTIHFVPYQNPRPTYQSNAVVMNNVPYTQTPSWHIEQSKLQIAFTSAYPPDTFVTPGSAPANLSTEGLTSMTAVRGRDDFAGYLPMDMDFYFFGINYKNASNAPGVYWDTNNVFGFGTSNNTINWVATTGPGILLGNSDRRTNTLSYSPVSTISTTQVVNTVLFAQNLYSDGIQSTLQWQMRFLRSPNYQYMEVRMSTVGATQGKWNITNGVEFQNTFGTLSTSAGQKGSSFVLRSDLEGNNWSLFYNHYIAL